MNIGAYINLFDTCCINFSIKLFTLTNISVKIECKIPVTNNAFGAKGITCQIL